MNEEELQLLVARARDAEGPASQPPTGLVDEARTAARRRRRVGTLAAGCAVAAVVVAAVAVPRVVAGDGDEPVAAVNTDELGEHGGPCPDVLPAPTDDDGYGFGTSTAADGDPRFATPDSAWVCQYATRDTAPPGHDGAVYEWVLTQAPRRVDDSLLEQVPTELDGIVVPEQEHQMCNADLGPRYVLVTSSGGDLTGVVLDDYGCRDVRLTDDPFVTAPGDPQDGGTVAGVLDAADGFADTLKSWWDTSPADVEAGPVPDELRVTCTDDGPQVASTTVAATPAGVVVVADSTMRKGSYLTYRSDGPSGGDAIEQMTGPAATYAFPPGRVTLGCASPPGMDETGTVDVEVVDPNGYWRTTTLADFGCTASSITDWISVSGSGTSAEAAVDGLVAAFADRSGRDPSVYESEPAPTGYSGADVQTWVVLRRGVPDYSVDVRTNRDQYDAVPNLDCVR